MNYQNSQSLLEKISLSNNILLNCHRSPDADTVGSALAMKLFLSSIGKQATIVCPDLITPEFSFLPNVLDIQTINFSTFNFFSYDLIILQDSSSPDVVTDSKDIALPSIFTAVIDHHRSNPNFGDLNIVDPERSSNAELLYQLFEDWNVPITSDISQCLLTGIVGDTGAFQYHDTSSLTMRIAATLMDNGGDRDAIIFNLFRRHPLVRTNLMGEILKALKIDETHHFVWSAIPYSVYSLYGDKEAKGVVASVFLQNIEGSDFGVIITEGNQGEVWVNLRSRVSSFDVSQIAVSLGGGGHKVAAGATLTGLSFDEAVELVLSTCKKFSKK